MTKEDDIEAYINAFESTAAGWAKSQWAAVLIPCLIGPAQQAVDTLPTQDLGDYKYVREAILQTLKLNLEPTVGGSGKSSSGPITTCA